MPQIKIERIKEHTHWPLKYTICLDDFEVETIGNDETKDVTIAEGPHTMYIKKGASKSQVLSFNLGENETKTFQVSVAESVKNATTVGKILYAIMVISVPFIGHFGMGLIIFYFALIIALFGYSYSLQNDYFSLVEVERQA